MQERETLFPSGPRFGLTFVPKFDKALRALNIRYNLARYVPHSFRISNFQGTVHKKKGSTYTTNWPDNAPCIFSTNGLPFMY